MLGRKVLVGSSGPSRGKPPGGENVPSARGIMVERREAPPPTSLGGAHLARRAADPLVRKALRYWARRLPALHSLVSRETEKGERAGPAARKVKWPDGDAR